MIKSSLVLGMHILHIMLLSELCQSVENCTGCNFYYHKHVSSSITKLKPLCGKRFPVKESVRTYFNYLVGICVSAEIAGRPDIGVLQKDSSKSKDNIYVLGNLSQADIMSGKNWVMLQYEGGNNYSQSCGQSQRKVIIMIVCDPTAYKQSIMKFVEKNNRKSEDCYYLFQLEDFSVCSNETPVSKFGAGSILCIIFCSCLFIYLIVGSMIKRFIHGAKGVNQVPNIQFWMELGNLMADGCNLACRCGREKDSYLGDRGHPGRSLLENANDHVDVDDGLLGM